MPSHKIDWRESGVSSGESWVGREGWMRWEQWMRWECCVFGAAVAATGYWIWAPGLGRKFPLMLGTGFTRPQVVPGTGIRRDWEQRPAGKRKGSGSPRAAAGKALLPSLAALPDKSQRESQPWKTLSV